MRMFIPNCLSHEIKYLPHFINNTDSSIFETIEARTGIISFYTYCYYVHISIQPILVIKLFCFKCYFVTIKLSSI